MNSFLEKEYEMCFEQIRFYDERQNELLKYLFTLTSAVAAGQFAIYKVLGSESREFFLCLAFLSGVVFVATILIYLSMLQNRLYFVFTARQINAIRGFCLAQDAPDFKGNQLYTSTDFRAIKPFSVHTYFLLGTSFLSSAFGALAVYSAFCLWSQSRCILIGVLSFVVLLLATLLGGYFYLRLRGSQSADEAIHGVTEKKGCKIGTANVSQPFHAETNQTSSEAGSRH